MKKIICLILSVAIMLCLCSINAFARDYPINVDDIGLVSGNITYDESTETLTLDNAVIEATGVKGIYCYRSTTIKLIGNNIIRAADGNTSFSTFITSEAQLILEGVDTDSKATLTLEDSNANLALNCEATGPSKLIIKNATVNITVNDCGITCESLTLENSEVDIKSTVGNEWPPIIARSSVTLDNSTLKVERVGKNANSCLNYCINDSISTLTVNNSEFILLNNNGPAIDGDNVDIKFNSGLIKLASSKGYPTIKIKKDLAGSIDYSAIGLYEENEGQKIIAHTEGEDAYVFLGYDEDKYATTSTFISPAYTEGVEQSVEASKDATFRINVDDKYFDSVLVDGSVVDPSNYNVSHGSTIITLLKDYLAKLAPGKHTLVVKYDIYGSTVEVPTTFTLAPEEETVADTADTNLVGIYVALMSFSVFGTGLVVKKRKIDE